MSTRRRKPTDPPEPESSGHGEEEPIEILEVVGVDETTGAVKKGTAPAPPAHGRPAPPPVPVDDTGPRHLEEALREKDRYYDLLLRKQAELDNYRKRTERERAESGLAGVREVLQRLLPVLDNMERALRTGEPSNDPLRRGIELVFLFRFGLFSLARLSLALRSSAGSSACLTVSGVSPSLAARLMSMATV